ncbi:hypothetical protein V8Z74_14750 [Comamonas sp. w2-DMI]|uniref:hypothetical protein n=1 Tax=Comamonas sp. w2-DMI TaxID=3126391 RepID=UPI0032E3A024
MTVLVAYALHDAVVLVADGRVSYPGEVITEDAVKWDVLNPSLTLGLSGVVDASSYARQVLSSCNAQSADEWRDQIHATVIAAGNLLPRVDDPVAMERLKVGIAGAGYDDEGFFVAATLFGPAMQAAHSQFIRGCVGTVKFVVVGGADGLDLQGHLTSQIRKLKIPSSTEPTAKVFHRQLAAAATTSIRYAARSDFSVGSKVRYTIKRRDLPDFSGWHV